MNPIFIITFTQNFGRISKHSLGRATKIKPILTVKQKFKMELIQALMYSSYQRFPLQLNLLISSN